MIEPAVLPKVFISYSWTSEEHVNWVEGVARRLEADSIPVVFDQWDLTHGQDKFAYMERMVGDPTITKVLMICDRRYVEKANARDGGVGDETVIITPEVYGKTSQTKFIPLLRERGDDGEALLPIYLKSRIYIDFCNDDDFAESYDKLLRDITNKPTRKRPPRGEKLPAHLLEESAPFVATGPKLEKLKHAVTSGKPHVKPLFRDYLRTFANSLQEFRIGYSPSDGVPFDDRVAKSITSFLGYRDNFIDFVSFVCGYLDNEETYEEIHSFFEQILPYKERLINTTHFEYDYDNYKFILYEMTLYFVAILVREKKYAAANFFMERDFNYENGFGSPEHHQFGIGIALYSYINSLEEMRSRRKDVPGPKTTADFVHARATADIKFSELVQADLLIHIKKYFPGGTGCDGWYPTTIHRTHNLGSLPLFAKATSARGIEPFKHLLKVGSLTQLWIGLDQMLKSPDFHLTFNSFRIMRSNGHTLMNLTNIHNAVNKK